MDGVLQLQRVGDRPDWSDGLLGAGQPVRQRGPRRRSASGRSGWPGRALRRGQFQLFGPHQTDYINYVRHVSAVHDGSRWQFISTGTPQPFERPEAYRARRIPDRFTSDLLAEYCAALGFRPLEPAAYGAARLVRSHPPTPDGIAEISLQQAQRNLGIDVTEPCPAKSLIRLGRA